jgi:hypothetical protein
MGYTISKDVEFLNWKKDGVGIMVLVISEMKMIVPNQWVKGLRSSSIVEEVITN